MIGIDQSASIVRQASRALGRSGLVHAYGHCSTRLDDLSFLVSPSKPLGMVKDSDACHVVRLDQPLPTDVLGEVRIHREIYRRRPDVKGVVRCMPPNVMAIAAHGATLKPRHGFGAYFYPAPAMWDDPQLLRSDDSAAALADMLGAGRGILMRGNGAVTAGSSLQEAVVLAWYLEDMARVEIAGCTAGLSLAPTLTEDECAVRATWTGGIVERMWAWLIDES